MLSELSIKDLILIDRIDIVFGKGLNVLSGETGAGKSILLDALGLVLGNRADTSLIRQGKESLCVTATFDNCLKNKSLCNLCENYELEIDDEVIIKRTLNIDGKGKIFFNDQPISQKLLKEIALHLVEINGQFANQGLLNSKNHLLILDEWGEHKEAIELTRSRFETYKKLQTELISAQQKWQKAKEDEELITHFATELKQLNPKHGEENELQERRREMMNAEKITENFNYAYQSLSAKSDVCAALRQAMTAVDRSNKLLDGKYEELYNLLDSALEYTSSALSEIEDTAQNLSFNSDEQSRIEERLFALKAAARKHNVTIEELPEVYAKYCEQLDCLHQNGDDLQQLEIKTNQARIEFLAAAKDLSAKRKNTALTFSKNIMSELAPLKMDKASFEVKFEELPKTQWNELGIDNVEFLVATNPNSPMGSIDKIASGGELARLMLAIKVVLADKNNISTMIFDEIDSGVGGATAQAVGDRLSKLSNNVQILAVTHSPQVAAKSNIHFKVEKYTDLMGATTQIHKLSEKEKTEEIARMISGENISSEAIAAAKVLIAE